MDFPKPSFSEKRYKSMVRSTNLGAAITVVFVGALGVVAAIDAVSDRKSQDYINVLIFLSFALLAIVVRKIALWWYRIVFHAAHGKYPDE